MTGYGDCWLRTLWLRTVSSRDRVVAHPRYSIAPIERDALVQYSWIQCFTFQNSYGLDKDVLHHGLLTQALV